MRLVLDPIHGSRQDWPAKLTFKKRRASRRSLDKEKISGENNRIDMAHHLGTNRVAIHQDTTSFLAAELKLELIADA